MADVSLSASPSGYDVSPGTIVKFYSTSRGTMSDGTPAQKDDYKRALVHAGFGADIDVEIGAASMPNDWPSEAVPALNADETPVRGTGLWQGQGQLPTAVTVLNGPTLTLWQAWSSTDGPHPNPNPTPVPNPNANPNATPGPMLVPGASSDKVVAAKANAYHLVPGAIYRVNALVNGIASYAEVAGAFSSAGFLPLGVWGPLDQPLIPFPTDWPMVTSGVDPNQRPIYAQGVWRGKGKFKGLKLDAARPIVVTGVWQHGAMPKALPGPGPSPSPMPHQHFDPSSLPVADNVQPSSSSGGNGGIVILALLGAIAGVRMVKRG